MFEIASFIWSLILVIVGGALLAALALLLAAFITAVIRSAFDRLF